MIVFDGLLFFLYLCGLSFCKTRSAILCLVCFVLANAYLYSSLYDFGNAWANHFVVGVIYVVFSALCWWVANAGKTALALLSVSVVNVVASFDYVFYPNTKTLISDSWLFLILSANALVLFSIFKGQKDGTGANTRNNSANIAGDSNSQAVYKH